MLLASVVGTALGGAASGSGEAGSAAGAGEGSGSAYVRRTHASVPECGRGDKARRRRTPKGAVPAGPESSAAPGEELGATPAGEEPAATLALNTGAATRPSAPGLRKQMALRVSVGELRSGMTPGELGTAGRWGR